MSGGTASIAFSHEAILTVLDSYEDIKQSIMSGTPLTGSELTPILQERYMNMFTDAFPYLAQADTSLSNFKAYRENRKQILKTAMGVLITFSVIIFVGFIWAAWRYVKKNSEGISAFQIYNQVIFLLCLALLFGGILVIPFIQFVRKELQKLDIEGPVTYVNWTGNVFFEEYKKLLEDPSQGDQDAALDNDKVRETALKARFADSNNVNALRTKLQELMNKDSAKYFEPWQWREIKTGVLFIEDLLSPYGSFELEGRDELTAEQLDDLLDDKVPDILTREIGLSNHAGRNSNVVVEFDIMNGSSKIASPDVILTDLVVSGMSVSESNNAINNNGRIMFRNFSSASGLANDAPLVTGKLNVPISYSNMTGIMDVMLFHGHASASNYMERSCDSTLTQERVHDLVKRWTVPLDAQTLSNEGTIQNERLTNVRVRWSPDAAEPALSPQTLSTYRRDIVTELTDASGANGYVVTYMPYEQRIRQALRRRAGGEGEPESAYWDGMRKALQAADDRIRTSRMQKQDAYVTEQQLQDRLLDANVFGQLSERIVALSLACRNNVVTFLNRKQRLYQLKTAERIMTDLLIMFSILVFMAMSIIVSSQLREYNLGNVTWGYVFRSFLLLASLYAIVLVLFVSLLIKYKHTKDYNYDILNQNAYVLMTASRSLEYEVLSTTSNRACKQPETIARYRRLMIQIVERYKECNAIMYGSNTIPFPYTEIVSYLVLACICFAAIAFVWTRFSPLGKVSNIRKLLKAIDRLNKRIPVPELDAMVGCMQDSPELWATLLWITSFITVGAAIFLGIVFVGSSNAFRRAIYNSSYYSENRCI